MRIFSMTGALSTLTISFLRTEMLEIREASETDFDKIWPIFQAIVSAGDTNAYPTDVTKAEGKRFGLDTPRKTFVAEDDGELLGSYYIKTNQAGPGAHVCTCGYMVAASARGRGIATAMCKHSQTIALELGYEAMQFNFVASSNEGAVRLWHEPGFAIVGRLPGAFKHPDRGNIDALVMYKWLFDDA
jgi:L-amino acid N-acyltransferase YncA